MKIFGIILIAVLVLVPSCSPALPQDSTKEGSARPLKFGAVYQLSGPQAFYGGMARYGLELAVEDINSAGGIDGRKVVVVYEDSAGDVAKAATSAKKLTEVDDVDALFTITPPMAGAVSPVAEDGKVPYIYIGSVDIFAINKSYVFKDYPSPVDLCRVLAVKAKNEGYSSIALLGRNDLVTSQCKEGATNVLNLSVFETYTPGDMDFKAQLSKIKASQSEALILYGLADECPVLFKQIKELGLDARLFLPVQSFACGSDANTKSYEGLLSGAFGSDIALDESSQDPVFLSFKKRLDERNWSIHIRGSALEYDIVNEMAEAYHGCQDRSCAADHLRAMRRKGITGEVSYNGGQIVKREVMLTRYSDGKWVKGD